MLHRFTFLCRLQAQLAALVCLSVERLRDRGRASHFAKKQNLSLLPLGGRFSCCEESCRQCLRSQWACLSALCNAAILSPVRSRLRARSSCCFRCLARFIRRSAPTLAIVLPHGSTTGSPRL